MDELQQLNIELANQTSYKREYLKGIISHKKNEPEDNDPTDYEEIITTDDWETTKTIVVPKPHKEWETQLANLEDWLSVCKEKIIAITDEITIAEETLLS